MTIGAWLGERDSAPPQLTARIVDVVGHRLEEPADQACEVFLDAAARLLGELVTRRTAGRESALDLLTVDALVTYAFEAASVAPERLPGRAAEAMRRLASVGAA
jgi:hypothetical protein